jgi:hypothetical protein
MESHINVLLFDPIVKGNIRHKYTSAIVSKNTIEMSFIWNNMPGRLTPSWFFMEILPIDELVAKRYYETI